MKLTLLSAICPILHEFSSGQITTATTKANFGVEADLRANFFDNANALTGDDWFRVSVAGSGKGVIDTTGAAEIAARYFADPVSRRTTMSRLMSVPPYSLSNNKLLLDAVFHRDYHGNDSTVFGGGSNKNGMSPANWASPGPGNIPDKNEFLDAMVHVRRDGPDPTDSLWMFGSVSLENTTGNRFFDFELYQTDIVFDFNTRKFIGYGPDAGHTSWELDASGKIVSPGDIVFTAEFSSSSLTNVEARIWVNKATLDITPLNFNWGEKFDGAGSGASYGYANILPKTPGDFYTGLQNTISTWAGPFLLIRANDAIASSYAPGQFMELSINLSKLGIEPGNIYGNYCGTPFRRVLIKSRSSTSFTSELKDFIAPFRLFDYPPQALSFIQYFCETMPLTPVSVSKPNPNFTYTWNTRNGNIVGSNIGDTIYVDAPGTYFVQQQKHLACLPDDMDSVTIFFDSVCMVLNPDINNLNARNEKGVHRLEWEVANNHLSRSFTVEVSYDNRNFKSIATIPPKNKRGDVSYDFNYRSMHNQPISFYRIKAEGNSGALSHSNLAVIRNDKRNDINRQLVVFPNPGNGDFKVATFSNGKAQTKYEIFDQSGKSTGKGLLVLNAGLNYADLPQLSGLANGLYIIVFYTPGGIVSQKVIVRK